MVSHRLKDLENELVVAGGWSWEGIVREFGINMYTLLHLKQITNNDLWYSTGLLNIKWQPGWEESLGENGYLHVHGWGPLLFTCNCHNILNQLCAVLCLVAQSCPSLCDHMATAQQAPLPMGILHARILEWVAYTFSRGTSQPRNWTGVSREAH